MSLALEQREPGHSRPSLLGFAVALVLVNTLLTYENAWPTPWISLSPRLSVELAVVILLIAIFGGQGRLPRPLRLAVTLSLAALLIAHYADVTTEGLFGKPIDVYWDLAHLPNATAMLAGRAPARLAAIVLGSATLLALLFLFCRWAVGALARPMAVRSLRIILTAAAGTVLAVSALGVPIFARPGAIMIIEQARLVATNVGGIPRRSSPSLPPLSVGATSDVFVVFFESYAGSVYADTDLSRRVEPARQRLTDLVERSGWRVASALVTAPTFGGASWLAHASLLSGTTIDNQRDYNAFLEAPPATLVDRFREAGYRTVALMPGLIDPWPEGAGLRFDAIYPRRDIAYTGRGFGFWQVPDQASLAWLSASEMTRPDRPPLFVMFPTVMSHIPFGPVPPYLEDWEAFQDGDPFVASTVRNRVADQRFDYRTPYVAAVSYNLDVIGGFLDAVARPNSLVIALGDHPPPAIVGGPNGSWTVPVHVFSNNADRLEPFRASGFVDSMWPRPETIGEMAVLTRLVLATDLAADGR